MIGDTHDSKAFKSVAGRAPSSSLKLPGPLSSATRTLRLRLSTSGMIGDDEMTSHLIVLGGALGPRLRGWVGAVGAQLEVAVHELHARRKLLDHLLGLGLHAAELLHLFADRQLLVLPCVLCLLARLLEQNAGALRLRGGRRRRTAAAAGRGAVAVGGVAVFEAGWALLSELHPREDQGAELGLVDPAVAVAVEEAEEALALVEGQLLVEHLQCPVELLPVERAGAIGVELLEYVLHVARLEATLLQELLDVHGHLDNLLLLPRGGEGVADDRDGHRGEDDAADERRGNQEPALEAHALSGEHAASQVAVVPKREQEPEDGIHRVEDVGEGLGLELLQDAAEDEGGDEDGEHGHEDRARRALDRDDEHAPARIVPQQLEDAQHAEQAQELGLFGHAVRIGDPDAALDVEGQQREHVHVEGGVLDEVHELRLHRIQAERQLEREYDVADYLDAHDALVVFHALDGTEGPGDGRGYDRHHGDGEQGHRRARRARPLEDLVNGGANWVFVTTVGGGAVRRDARVAHERGGRGLSVHRRAHRRELSARAFWRSGLRDRYRAAWPVWN